MTGPVHYRFGDFPPAAERLDWARLVPLIGPATAALARFDGLVRAIPNANVLLSPLTTQEAVLSSKIEGTNVTMGEVMEIEAGAGGDLGQPKRDDAEEVLNYRKALGFAAAALQDRPLSLHLLREAHALLLQGVRGRDKNPGALRTEQNWIGPPGCPIDQASFVPIAQEHLIGGLDRWAAFVADAAQPDPLVQLALAHLEFEALHPFKDGNGRMGRMLIPLFLMQRGVLSSPSFYLSGYLEARRDDYIERMRAVSRDGAWTEWCLFFLRGIIDQARENQEKAQAIIDLHTRMLRRVADLTHSQHAGKAVAFLFSHPIFSTTIFIERADIPRPTALRMLRLLRDDGVLDTIRDGAGNRAAIYAFSALLTVAEGRPLSFESHP